MFSNGQELHARDGEYSSDESDEQDPETAKDVGRKALRKPKIYGKSIQEDDEEIDGLASDEELEDDASGDESHRQRRSVEDFSGSGNDPTAEAQTDSEFELSDHEDDVWPQSTASRLQEAKRRPRKWDIGKLIYMDNITPSDCLKRWRGELEEEGEEPDGQSDEEEFFKQKDENALKKSEVEDDLEKFKPHFETFKQLMAKWSTLDSLKHRFIGAPSARNQASVNDGDDGDEELYGDFEDLEANDGSDSAEEQEQNSGEDEEDDNQSDHSFTNFDQEESKDLSTEQERERNAAKKESLRLQFEMEEGDNFKEDDPNNEYDTWYELQKAKMAKQLEINNAELNSMTPEQRQKIEGFKAGSYVRIVFDALPMEFVENLDPRYPIIMGGLLPTELKFGVLKARLRRHRWHKKILKTNDPLVLSLGWRRFQTLPVYTTSDSRTRNRMLKYTPEHSYCSASFYGPLCAPNTTFCGVQIVANSDTTGNFRISATGIVEEIDASVEIVKKLKLACWVPLQDFQKYRLYQGHVF